MVISSKEYEYFMRGHGNAKAIIHQQILVPGLSPQPYRGIIREAEREGATTEERLLAIAGPEV